ncbi:Nif3-like dinuclear metal center hexameric protein [Roseburia sp. 499]|uniref:Nif3-like dinuclear metal center hexameric protein n=1 Tax=Roseburia sp. 499 TaxID=1261634 RepID=UPI000950EB6F|nr:Nif3-like dinuclear metal center hexameric protein [Roseburia sp. 499]WVK70774.1 Nif3-like dinuclear metal center hexameric protein [Roseburia sp. 499]
MKCQEIITILQKQAPEHYACDWDNVGLLVGDSEKEVHKIYIALDATEETIEEAVAAKADMLLTHHPMIFRGLKKVNSADFVGKRVMSLIREDIAYYAMHTNFDVKGMAELAADRMMLKDCQVLDVTCEDEEGLQGIGKVGNLSEPMKVRACAELVKKAFHEEQVKVFGNLDKKISRVAISPGSGKSVIGEALKNGAEVLITGDIDHHEGIDAAAQGMAVIDAGHYGVEKIFIPYMRKYLEENTEGITIIEQPEKKPFVYI